MVCFLMFLEDSISAVGSLATGEAFPWRCCMNCLTSTSRGGDETRHKYLTHSEGHTDSKFVGLLKLINKLSGLPNKYSRNQINFKS